MRLADKELTRVTLSFLIILSSSSRTIVFFNLLQQATRL